MKFDTAIFDLDGTILNTLADLRDSVNFALVKNGLPERSTEEIRSFVGNGIRLLIERAVPESTECDVVDKCFLDFKEHYKFNSDNKTKPYNGVTELLKELKKSGIKLALVSNKADFAVQGLVNKYFPDIFGFVTGEKDNIRRKPCPDSVFAAMEYLGSDRNNTVYIGDSEVDIETSKNSRIACVAVTWGFRDKDILIGLNPEYIVDTPEQITEIMK
ncbi:MAG: HAD family hydrolase [Clostridia bacterium]|nr:HAD family hydrolase [Clostridia bacterium]